MRIRFHNILKVGVSIALIALLVLVIGGEQMMASFQRITVGDLLSITLLCSVSLALLAKRFQKVLLAGGIRVTWHSVYSLQLMGLTINQFMPGLYGGDLLRIIYYMPAHGNKKQFLTAAVFFERICGLLAMSVVGMFSSALVAITMGKMYWLIMTFALLFALFAMIVFGRWMFRRRVNTSRLPRWVRLSSRVASELSILFGNRRLFAKTTLLSMLSQGVSIILYWYLLMSMEIDLFLPAVAGVVSLGWLITLVPVSLNGLGLRESGLVVGFISFGIGRGVALSISLAALLPTLIYALIGAILLAWNMEKIGNLRKLVTSS